MERVILVDEHDEEIGLMEKIEAHEKGLLHRAFSIFIFNQKGEMLLQQRGLRKYHSGGLWTNACCSHPKPNEKTIDAAHRRLKEEMGFDTELTKAFDFKYKANFSNGLTEHEFDHVFVGYYDGKIEYNFDEVETYAYRSMDRIEASFAEYTDFYTEWFVIAFPKIKEWVEKYRYEL
jgi:isopentenyl-diphosphate delta-isomerase